MIKEVSVQAFALFLVFAFILWFNFGLWGGGSSLCCRRDSGLALL